MIARWLIIAPRRNQWIWLRQTYPTGLWIWLNRGKLSVRLK